MLSGCLRCVRVWGGDYKLRTSLNKNVSYLKYVGVILGVVHNLDPRASESLIMTIVKNCERLWLGLIEVWQAFSLAFSMKYDIVPFFKEKFSMNPQKGFLYKI